MNRWICLIVPLVLLLGALTGCSGTTAGDAPPSSAADEGENGQRSGTGEAESNKGKDYLLASFVWNPLPYNPYSIKGF
ncbi:MAG: hypothetical protein K0Q94_5359, partial [Paenibacillus sp.]|nr:hypothetical protein [Paenibacillus sp.]